MNMINNYVNTYYIMIIAYSLYYLYLSFDSNLPWEKCDPKWASPSKFDSINLNLKLLLFYLIKNKLILRLC